MKMQLGLKLFLLVKHFVRTLQGSVERCQCQFVFETCLLCDRLISNSYTHQCDFIKCPELIEIDPNYCFLSILLRYLREKICNHFDLQDIWRSVTSYPSCSSWHWHRRPWSRSSQCSPSPGSRPDLLSHCKNFIFIPAHISHKYRFH